jgi:hypothetical protein
MIYESLLLISSTLILHTFILIGTCSTGQYLISQISLTAVQGTQNSIALSQETMEDT